jgi:phage terminase large subunit GpA-like protein
MINAQLRIKVKYPGPQLFMTSTDKVAEEFGRGRFELIIADMEPLRKRQMAGERGQMLVKRFVDGMIVLCGGQSVFNLQSSPYRVVVIDEYDSLVENLGGSGDPLKLAEVRTDSFSGETLLIVYAHPSTRDRGTGKLYYEESDQRRGHITHSCGHDFWLNWPEVVVCEPRPAEAATVPQTQEQAEKDPDCYHLICPGCRAKISEAERVAMLRAGVTQKSVLPPEEAAKKRWIGVHASQLYTPHKSMRSFYERWIETDCGRDENATRVFWNKVLGDVYEPRVKAIDIEKLRALTVMRRRPRDPEFYSKGQVPPGVLFLTAGQDSRLTQLHYAVWGWGVRESIDKTRWLCGWLIDWGEIDRKYSISFDEAEYHVFDDLLYRRHYPSNIDDRTYMVRGCAHDIGYGPTQIPIIKYCRSWPERALPAKGASETHSSSSKAPYVRKGTARRFQAGDEEHIDDGSLLFNTYMLKTDWYGFVEKRIEIVEHRDGVAIGTREVPRLTLPEDVDDRWLEHSKNETLARGKKTGEWIWKARGPNHLADCNTQAYGVALNFDPHAKNMTAEEYGQHRARQSRAPDMSDQADRGGYGAMGRHDDPAMG